jgi:sucrose synthase
MGVGLGPGALCRNKKKLTLGPLTPSLPTQAPRPFSPPPPPESAHHRFADAAAAVLRRLALHDDGGPPSPGGSPPTLADRVQAAVNARRNDVAALLDRVMSAAAASAADGGTAAGKESPPPFSPILMPHVLRDALAEEEECADGRRVRKRPPDGLGELLSMVTEAVVHPPTLALALRPDVGLAAYLALDGYSLRVSTLSVAQYLAVKEACAGVRLSLVEQVLGCVEIDLAPFWPRGLPSCAGRPANIGQGVSFINRCLCARMMRGGSGDAGGGPSPGAAALHSYLSNLSLGGTPLALNSRLRSPAALAPAVGRAIAWLETLPDDTPWAGDVAARMADMGFAPGWGASAGRARETLALLDDALAAPHPSHLEALLARLPGAGQAVVMVSPHGFFAQSGALGKPDTGGQVVYVLDAVRALERELADRAAAAGLLGSDADGGDGAFPPPRIIILTRLIPDAGDTSCNLRREAVEGTNGAVILRVPFRNGGGVVKKWVSRFQVWPFLEQFAVDGASEIMAELGGHAPDLVVGHYTDGGLVASLLVREFGQERTTMAFVAHALEKNKYPQSALRWASPELRAYNFGCHFTADLININRSDCAFFGCF